MNALTTDLPFPRNYATELLTFERGHGIYLEDTDGKQYLDLGAGIAVNALGYGRSDLARIAAEQMQKLVHVSNLYTTPPALELGRRLINSKTDRDGKPFAAVHFGSSGAEANEAALKYARLYAHETRGSDHHRLLTFSSGFHGRTMGALSVTPNPKYRQKFEPLIPGVEVAPYNDVDALERIVDSTFAAVIVEVIQGEGGLSTMTADFAHALNEICARHDVMLIADEIQTGLGRTGHLYAGETVDLRPDIISLSKPLAGGLPLSATLIPTKINELLHVGDHGTTFGGGPVTTAVALHVWDTISDDQFLSGVRNTAEHLEHALGELVDRFEFVRRLRGAGLLRGIELAIPTDTSADIMTRLLAVARERGLLVLKSGVNVIRIAPPLIIASDEVDQGVELLQTVLSQIENEFEGVLS